MRKTLLIVLPLLLIVGCTTIPSGYVKISNDPNEKIYKKYDEFNQVTYYQHYALFNANSKSSINIYIVERNSNAKAVEDSRAKLEKMLLDTTIDDSQKNLISNVLDIPVPTNNQYLRCKFVYEAGSWIFFDKVIILNQDDEKMEWIMKSYDKDTYVNSGIVREVYDVLLTDIDVKKLFDFVAYS